MSVEDLDLYDALKSGNTDLLPFFFHLLWRKTHQGAKANADPVLGIHIPDTVVLHHSRVLAWYFTAKDGSIRKKSRRNLGTELLINHLKQKAKSISGCVATISESDPTSDDGYTQRFATKATVASAVSDDSSGVLQLFIDPKEERSGAPTNQIVVANWTPNVFFLERRINSSRLDNDKIPLEDRCTTADTSHLVRIAPLVSTRTTKVLEAECVAVAQHIESVFHYRVVGLHLHFCIDADDVAWLLRCTSMRIVARGDLSRTITLSLGKQHASTATSSPPKKKQPTDGQPAGAGVSGSHSLMTSGASVGGGVGLERRRTIFMSAKNRRSVTSEYSDEDSPSPMSKEEKLRRRRSTILLGAGPKRGSTRFASSSPDMSPNGSPSKASFNIATTQSRIIEGDGSGRDDSDSEENSKPVVNDDEDADEDTGFHCALCSTALWIEHPDPPLSGGGSLSARGKPFSSSASNVPSSTSAGASHLSARGNPATQFSTVALKHVLFPLSVLDFYSKNEPKVIFQQIWDPENDDIPSHVQLLFPQMLTADYAMLRDDIEWLNQPIPLCELCSQGLMQLTQAINVRRDGAIQYPFGQGRTAPKLNDIMAAIKQPVPRHLHIGGTSTNRSMGSTSARARSVSPQRGEAQSTSSVAKSAVTPQPTSTQGSVRRGEKDVSAFPEDISPYIERRSLKARIELPAIDAHRLPPPKRRTTMKFAGSGQSRASNKVHSSAPTPAKAVSRAPES